MPFAAGGLVLTLLFLLWVWAIFDCIRTDAALSRNLPKLIWLILIIILPTIGAVAWLILGRPVGAGLGQGPAPPRPARRIYEEPRYHPPEVITDRRSAELDAQLAAWEHDQEVGRRPAIEGPDRSDLAAREAALARREKELRRRELELDEHGRQDEPDGGGAAGS